jgi:probable rRNA maturation factor
MNKLPVLQISGKQPDDITAAQLEDALATTFDMLGLSSNVQVSLVFCSSEEMRAINKKYRGVDRTTDVLSFPAGQPSGLFPSNGQGIIFLGEILIDTDYILSQSTTDSLKMIVMMVFIHGVLHLLGYDHLNSKQKDKMLTLENKLKILIG